MREDIRHPLPELDVELIERVVELASKVKDKGKLLDEPSEVRRLHESINSLITRNELAHLVQLVGDSDLAVECPSSRREVVLGEEGEGGRWGGIDQGGGVCFFDDGVEDLGR